MPQPALRRLLPMISTVLVLTGCATLRSSDAPGCSGPRRPANPHGSVLAPDLPSTAAPADGSGGCAGGRS